MSQLEHDLKKHIDNKLHKWLVDSLALYEMANINNRAATGITEVLLRCVAASFAANGFTDEQASECLSIAMDRAREARERVIKRKGTGHEHSR